MRLIKLAFGAIAICLVSSEVRADLTYERFTILPDCKSILGSVGSTCKKSAPITRGTKKHYFSSDDFNWRCNSTGSLEFDFFNSSSRTVYTIVIEGTTANTRLSERVHVPPGSSEYLYVLSSGAFCRKEKRAKLYFEYQVENGGECIEFYSDEEMKKLREQCRKESEIKKEQNIIYNNCIVAKSKGVDRSAVRNLRSVCREISKNPSTLQRWRWGD